MARKTVVIGLLGTTLDAGHTQARWDRWRPSIAICQQQELQIDRFELIVSRPASRRVQQLVQQVTDDIAKVAPETEVRPHTIAIADPWDFSEVYTAFDRFAEEYAWRTASEDYYPPITTGTHVMQICLFLLCETRAMPGVLLQSSPGPRDGAGPRHPIGYVQLIDLELAKYDRLAARPRPHRENTTPAPRAPR